MSRRRRTPRLPMARTAFVAQLGLALVIAGFLFLSTGVRLPFVHATADLTVELVDAGGLDPRDRPTVTVGGVPAGRVTRVRFDQPRGRTQATVRIDRALRDRLFADARVRLLPRSALNDLVVIIDPGDPAAGPLRGARLASGPAPVTYDRVLATLDPQVQAYAQLTIGTLEQLLPERAGPLRDALDRLPTAVEAASAVSRRLAHRRRELRSVADELAVVAGVAADRRRALVRVVQGARRTLRVTAGRSERIAAALGELPQTLTGTRTALVALDRLSRPLLPALAGLRATARRLPSGLRELRRTAPQLTRLLEQVRRLDRDGHRPLRSLVAVGQQLDVAARGLAPAVPTLEKVVRTLVDNQADVRKLTDYWPGTLSSQNAVGVTTRSVFLRLAPVDPRALGLPAGDRSAAARLRGAERRLRQQRPELGGRLPGGGRDATLEAALGGMRALLTDTCRRQRGMACGVLSGLLAAPPREAPR